MALRTGVLAGSRTYWRDHHSHPHRYGHTWGASGGGWESGVRLRLPPFSLPPSPVFLSSLIDADICCVFCFFFVKMASQRFAEGWPIE